MKKLIYLFFLVVVMSGCASFSSVKYDDSLTYVSTNPTRIKVFSFEPPQKYVKIGEVSTLGAPLSNRENLINKLKIMAGEMGGDAIILLTSETPRIIGNAQGINTQYVPEMVGIVIRFTD